MDGEIRSQFLSLTAGKKDQFIADHYMCFDHKATLEGLHIEFRALFQQLLRIFHP